MKKLLMSVFLLFLMVPTSVSAAPRDGMKAAFIRSDNLWLIISSKETQVTNKEFIRYPKWSKDGNWLAYLKGPKQDFFFSGELWVYSLKRNEHFKVHSNVERDFQWAPNMNQLGFQSNKELFMMDTDQINREKAQPITTNIVSFSWLPNGQGFLTSAKENKEINSDIILSNIIFKGKNNQPVSTRFTTIPVEKDELYVSTSAFKWSNDLKWISFLLVPTASLSADANILCVLSSDGKILRRIDEMLKDNEWFEWAPSINHLAYINGVGREATSNKQLKILSVPSMDKRNFTPKGYVDRDLTWQNNRLLYVARSKENKWTTDLRKRPLPSLFYINTALNKASKMTFPPMTTGDFRPQVIKKNIVWIRTNRNHANVLFAPIGQKKADIWIKNMDIGNYYYEKWSWDQVFSVYQGE